MNGKLVPSSITTRLIKNAMKAQGWADKKYLIDGFPRNEDNYQSWNTELGDCSTIKRVLFFDCAEDILIERIKKRSESSGRTDDNEETLKKRLVTFYECQLPIIAKYEEQGLSTKIDTSVTVEEIYDKVKEAM